MTWTRLSTKSTIENSQHTTHPIAIQLSDVSVAFQGEEQIESVLTHLNLSILRGEWVALCGANGSGKSTLARVLAGFTGISKGTVDICGHPVRPPNPTTTNSAHPRLQMVFQNPEAQMIGETVWEEVSFGLHQQGTSKEALEAQVHAALSCVGISHLAQAPISTLSGGQKQLVCIADCMALQADILVFDEATAMLDEQARQLVLAAVSQIHAQGTTILWITQHLEEVSYASRVLALEGGRLAFDGTPTDFFFSPSSHGNPADATPPLSPCRLLGFPPPFLIAVVEELKALGGESAPLMTPPLTPETLLSELKAGRL